MVSIVKTKEKLPFIQKVEEDWKDKKFCYMAIERSPSDFQKCLYQDDKLVKRAVSLDIENIQFADDKFLTHTYALQLVKKNPEVVQFLPHRLYTRAIVYEVLKRNPKLIFFVGISETYQLRAVEEDGRVLQYCTNPSKKVIKIALKNNGDAIQFVKKDDPDYYDYCVLALKSKGKAIRFISKPDEYLCSLAINNDPMALEFVPTELKQSVEVRAQTLNSEAAIFAVDPIYEAAKFACFIDRDNILYFKSEMIKKLLKEVNYQGESPILKIKIFLRRLGWKFKR